MGSAGPCLPTKFPCWCRAVYSWGGETEKDLGFIEGDLIECLNAGDGMWWMGRLRRDRRMMGLFPSNFVVVLEESFVPISRSVSPIPDMHRADSSKNSIANLEKKKEKAKARRPFQGYKTATTPTGTGAVSKPTPVSAPVSQRPKKPNHDPANPPSTVLWQQRPVSRGVARSPSPMLHHEIGSSPPPPPPPHRSGISRAPSPISQAFDMNDRYQHMSRTPSPRVPSLNGHTPPMIRDAMDGVLLSLDGMGLGRRDEEPEDAVEEEHPPLNPWSPEAFEDLHYSNNRQLARPLTSIGTSAPAKPFSEPRPSYSSRHNSPDRFADGPPHLETYVERMEKQLRARAEARQSVSGYERDSEPPDPPPKNLPWGSAPPVTRQLSMQRRKSAYDVPTLNRTYTTRTNATNSTNSTNSSSGVQSVATNISNQSSRTSQSLMSGYSAGGFSATSAGSLARRNNFNSLQNQINVRPTTSAGTRSEKWNIEPDLDLRPRTPGDGVSYHSSHDTRAGARSAIGWGDDSRPMSSGGLGGFVTPKAKKGGFWKKLTDGGKTAFASSRSTIVPTSSVTSSQPGSPTKHDLNERITGIAGGAALISPLKKDRKSATSTGDYGRDAAKEMGLGGGPGSWVMSRRAVNRSNTPGPSERQERAERCQMLNEPVIYPIDELYETIKGDEGVDGQPVYEPFQLSNPSFSLVDKAARFVTNLPSSITSSILATAHVCRPYRSDVQRLRAIFIWCAERVSWDEDVSDNYGRQGSVDTRRVIQARRGSTREIAVLVMEMCRAIGIYAEVVRGYLKLPGEELDLDAASPAKANHYWNAVFVDKEWRMIDASLASPTHPKRSSFSSVSVSIAEAWYFLTIPSQMAWTHVPLVPEQQHMIPPISPDTLLALPGVCPPFFRLYLGMHNYDTSALRMEGLEITTLSISVPSDMEIVAEVETQCFLTDQDGDRYEDTDRVQKKRALSQPSWYQTQPHNPDSLQKRYVIKALLPGDEGVGVLKVYAGRKGLMHSAREIVHPLALAVPLYHSGENPRFDFVRRHPTPHATRQDLYVVQPQCFNLAAGETYVFCVRQHGASVISTPASEQGGFDFGPSSASSNNGSLANRCASPNPFIRPGSAMSMVSSATGSQASDPSTATPNGIKVRDKPAKLAIQSPGGKIIRLSRKSDSSTQGAQSREIDGIIQGSVWEAVCKVSERGIWRGLVLADRSARWCVWGEWECS